MHGISADGLAIKETHSPSTMGLFKETMLMGGEVMRSLIFLTLVSTEFGRNLGLSQPIMTVQTFFMAFSIIIFAITVVMHFYINETSKFSSI
jgi:hypothetical protein